MLPREETQRRIKRIYEKIIGLINEELLPEHRAGGIDAADVIFIATTALCESAASILFHQIPVHHYKNTEKVISDYCEMFRRDAHALIEENKKNGGAADIIQEETKSAWE